NIENLLKKFMTDVINSIQKLEDRISKMESTLEKQSFEFENLRNFLSQQNLFHEIDTPILLNKEDLSSIDDQRNSNLHPYSVKSNVNSLSKDLNFKIVNSYMGHSYAIYCICLSRDEKKLVSSSGDKTIKIWDIQSGKCETTLIGHKAQVYCVCVTHDNQYIISGSADNSIKVWTFNGELIHSIEGHSDYVRMVCTT